MALYNTLFYRFKMANVLTNEVVDTLIDALVYQPSNAAPADHEDNNPAKTYMFGAPSRLPKYLEQFAVDEAFKQNCVNPGPEMSVYKGVGGVHHTFLSSDGVRNCTRCNEIICPQCNDKIGDKTIETK